MLGYRPPADQH